MTDHSGPKARRIVFCDFDGTITDTETLAALLLTLAPDPAAEVLRRIRSREITVKDGVRILIQELDSDRIPDIVEFSRGQRLRNGFLEFLEFLNRRNVPFVLVSGGLRIMVETILGSQLDRMAGVHALDLDASGPKLRVRSEFTGDTELLAKVRVMELYEYDAAVAIGDGVTDRNMALAADTVFAKDGLAAFLDKMGRDYHPWNDFYDVMGVLEKAWDAKAP